MKILLLDLETSPMLGWSWEKYDTTILEVVKPREILMVGWNWYESDKIWAVGGPEIPEKKLVERLWELLDEADVVVAHNGDKFDLRVSNARLLHYGFKPPSPYKTVDTLKIARRNFYLESNKLTDLARYLGVGEKLANTGWALWKACLAGDPEAWKQMKDYNVQDVRLLKAVYIALRPWAINHPNLALYDRVGSSCPTCKSNKVQRRGFSVLKERVKQRFQCTDCGTWFAGDYAKREELKEYAAA